MENEVKKFGTPNQKSLYQRLGLMMEELQNQPFYKGKALELSKLAHQMTKAYITEMERARFEKEMTQANYTIDIENKNLAIE